MKKQFFLSLVIAVALILFCQGVIAQQAHFSSKGGMLFNIDGKWGPQNNLSYTTGTYKTDVDLEPGEHTFVYLLKDAVYEFTVDIKAGEKYQLDKGKPLKLKEGKTVLENIEFKKVNANADKDGIYWLTDERDLSKVAIFEYDRKLKLIGFDHSFRLKIVDDVWGETRFGYNNLWNGNFKIALSPGEHTLRAHSIADAGNTMYYLKYITVLTHNFEAGKKYTASYKSKDLESVEIVELNE